MSYPFVDPELQAKLSVLPLESKQAMLGSVTGRHRSLNHGSSVEFSEYRKYVQGDDIRMLDWKAFARSDRYYIKQSEADTNMLVHSLIDCSGSMNFDGSHGSKIDLVKKLVATLSALAIRQGDAAGIHCVSSSLDLQIRPKRKPSHLHQIYQSLNEVKVSGETGLCHGIHQLAQSIQRRGLVLIFSDFFCDLESLKEALLHVKHRKHEVCLFQILDPMELEFNFSQAHRFIDLEDGSHVHIEGEEIRDEYLALMQDFLQGVEGLASEALVEHHLIRSSDSAEEVLTKFLHSRSQNFLDS
ncbi:DUF58 domain-containing protein [Rubritalea marina]|uniref:DUF58 domain-containing protein n=1 Tax=Rubritalea marina TaxID=361055 RepID=UPI000366E485|nr:DUF58 domain-containing protein [Rubritalea marina]